MNITTIDFKNPKWVDGFLWGVSIGVMVLFLIMGLMRL